MAAALVVALAVPTALAAPLSTASAQQSEEDPPWVHEDKRAAEGDPAADPSRHRPESRVDFAMAYHPGSDEPRTGRTILFGGSRYCGIGEEETGGCQWYTPMADTWAWDGVTWTRLSPETSPPPQSNAQLAYHARTKKLVLFGGHGTWTWDGTTWTEEHPRASPPPHSFLMADHEASERVLVFARYRAADGKDVTETWTWDGWEWTKENPATSPPPRSDAAMADHKPSRKLVLAGGCCIDHSLGRPWADTWTWDGSPWKQEADPTPSAGVHAAATYLAATGEVVAVIGHESAEADRQQHGHHPQRLPGTAADG